MAFESDRNKIKAFAHHVAKKTIFAVISDLVSTLPEVVVSAKSSRSLSQTGRTRGEIR